MRTFTKNLFSVLFITLISMSLLVTTGCDEDDVIDEMVGTWTLYEMQMESETLNAAELAAEGMSMTVVFTAETYTAIGVMGDEVINETGTWTRQDSNTIIITNTDGNVTLTKEGEYYTTEFDEGIIGKFKKS
ncbi:MAG: hypothetical protein KAR57_04420 [Bacteroidales bacterium]|nr:hypothetical protein [Bacteroidales bacterium]